MFNIFNCYYILDRGNDEYLHLLENEDISENADNELAFENVEESQLAAENDDVFSR